MKHFCLVLMAILFLSCSNNGQNYPGETWDNHENPASLGWSEEDLSLFNRFLTDSTQITGLMLVQQGKVIYDFGDLEENSYIASCRKSILAILYGKYVESGQIDLKRTLGSMGINDHSPLLEVEKGATIEDIISARSGVFLPGSNGGDFRRLAPERGSVKAGSYWLYSNWDFNLAGHIFETESKRNIYDEIEEQLVLPLEMQDWDRTLQRKSGDLDVSKFPAYHMWFSTRDMARIGHLILSKGQWKGNQVVSEKWIQEMTRERTSYLEAQRNAPILKEDGLDLGYGYMWWLIQNTEDYRLKNAYSAQGALGQNITIFPNIDLVLVFKTNGENGRRNSIQTQMKIIKKAAQIYNPN